MRMRMRRAAISGSAVAGQVPGTIADLYRVVQISTQVLVAFTIPSGSPFGYQWSNDGTTWAGLVVNALTTPPSGGVLFTATGVASGLTPSTSYGAFRIRAVGLYGNGLASNQISFTTPATVTPTFIDPAAGTNGSGTFASPKNTYSGLTLSGSKIFLQKAGTTWSAAINLTAGGTGVGTELIFGTYDATTGLQVLDGSQRAIFDGAGQDTIFTIDQNASYISLLGLELKDSGIEGNDFNAAIVIYKSSGMSSHVTVAGCNIHDMQGFTYSIRSCCNNLLWLANIVTNTGDDNLHLDGGNNVEIGYSTFINPSTYSVSGDNVQMSDQVAPCNNGRIHHCVMEHAVADVKTCILGNYFTADHTNFHDWIIEDCDLDAGPSPSGGKWVIGIHIANVTVRRNILRNGQRFIDVGGGATGFVAYSNIGITANVSTNSRGINNGGSNTSKYYNNVFINTVGTFANSTHGIVSQSGDDVKNNILVGWKTGFSGGGTADHNCFFGCQTNGSAGTGTVASNPLFVNSPNDVRLQAGSPCIAAGVDPGITITRFDGSAMAAPFNIGAF